MNPTTDQNDTTRPQQKPAKDAPMASPRQQQSPKTPYQAPASTPKSDSRETDDEDEGEVRARP